MWRRTGVSGFTQLDGSGVWTGLRVDICRVAAAMTFGGSVLHLARRSARLYAMATTISANIVRWAIDAMIEAEEHGITSANGDRMVDHDDPQIRRLLGETPGIGRALRLDDKWVYDAIKQVGNCCPLLSYSCSILRRGNGLRVPALGLTDDIPIAHPIGLFGNTVLPANGKYPTGHASKAVLLFGACALSTP